jgi:hypothetical protein
MIWFINLLLKPTPYILCPRVTIQEAYVHLLQFQALVNTMKAQQHPFADTSEGESVTLH